MKTYRTLNSVYEVDEEAKRFRRTEGVNPPPLVDDGEWLDYSQAIHTPTGALLIYLPSQESVFDQKFVLTSKATLVGADAGAQP